MPFVPMNLLLNEPLQSGAPVTLPYPEGKGEGYFFGGVNHTVTIGGNFYRSPRDFTLLPQPHGVVLSWNLPTPVRAGTLLNIQVESPGGDFYYDSRFGVTVTDMVASPLFMINLAAPAAVDPSYWSGGPVHALEKKPVALRETQVQTPRNVTIHSQSDISHCRFVIEGEDLYRRTMVEHLQGGSEGVAEGKKAFARITSIIPSHGIHGQVSIGAGNRLGLPVFLPAPGYLIREIIDGHAVTGGLIASGETALPSGTTGDRRGTYTPPDHIELNGSHNIHLLVSLLAPGNIGIPDFTG